MDVSELSVKEKIRLRQNQMESKVHAKEDDVYMMPNSRPATRESDSMNINKFDATTIDNFQLVDEETYMTPKAPRRLIKKAESKFEMVDMSTFCISPIEEEVTRKIVIPCSPKKDTTLSLKSSSQTTIRFVDISHPLSQTQNQTIQTPEEVKFIFPEFAEENTYVEAENASTSPCYRKPMMDSGVREQSCPTAYGSEDNYMGFDFPASDDHQTDSTYKRKHSVLVVKDGIVYDSFISIKVTDECSELKMNSTTSATASLLVPEMVEMNPENEANQVYLDLGTNGEDECGLKDQILQLGNELNATPMGGKVSRSKLFGCEQKNERKQSSTQDGSPEISTIVTRPDGSRATVRLRKQKKMEKENPMMAEKSRPLSMPFAPPPEPPSMQRKQTGILAPPVNPGQRPLPPTPRDKEQSTNLFDKENDMITNDNSNDHGFLDRKSSMPSDPPPFPPTAEKPPPLLPRTSSSSFAPKLPFRPSSKILTPEGSESTTTPDSPQRTSLSPALPDCNALAPRLKTWNRHLTTRKEDNSPSQLVKKEDDTSAVCIESTERISTPASRKIHPIAEILKKKQSNSQSLRKPINSRSVSEGENIAHPTESKSKSPQKFTGIVKASCSMTASQTRDTSLRSSGHIGATLPSKPPPSPPKQLPNKPAPKLPPTPTKPAFMTPLLPDKPSITNKPFAVGPLDISHKPSSMAPPTQSKPVVQILTKPKVISEPSASPTHSLSSSILKKAESFANNSKYSSSSDLRFKEFDAEISSRKIPLRPPSNKPATPKPAMIISIKPLKLMDADVDKPLPKVPIDEPSDTSLNIPNKPRQVKSGYTLHKLQAERMASLSKHAKKNVVPPSSGKDNVSTTNDLCMLSRVYTAIDELPATYEQDINNTPSTTPQSTMREQTSPKKTKVVQRSATFNNLHSRSAETVSSSPDRERKMSLQSAPPSNQLMPRSPGIKAKARPNIPPPPRPGQPRYELNSEEKNKLAPIRPPPPSMNKIREARLRREVSRVANETSIRSPKHAMRGYKQIALKDSRARHHTSPDTSSVTSEDDATYSAILDISSGSTSNGSEEIGFNELRIGQTDFSKKKKMSLGTIATSVSAIKSKIGRAKTRRNNDQSHKGSAYSMASEDCSTESKRLPTPDVDTEGIYAGIDDDYLTSSYNGNNNVYLASIPAPVASSTEFTYAELDHGRLSEIFLT